jgi:hypothetical protein
MTPHAMCRTESAVLNHASRLSRLAMFALLAPAVFQAAPALATGSEGLRFVSLTVTEAPPKSVEKMTSRDQGSTTIIYWPTATARGGVDLVIDHCLRFGQQCGQPAADAVCRRLMPGRPSATKFLTAKPRGGATVVLGSNMDYCWDRVCTGFSEVHCARTQATTGTSGAPAPAPAPAPTKPQDPRTCKAGFVWRVAHASDLVCVTPESRQRVGAENASARSRIDPRGAYGPASCLAGYVWREAFRGDTVCVAPEVRTLVQEENRLAATRRVGG